MSELTSYDDEETVNSASATMIFSSCALLFDVKRKCVILCGFKATCSLVNTGLTPLLYVCPFRWSLTLHSAVRQLADLSVSACISWLRRENFGKVVGARG